MWGAIAGDIIGSIHEFAQPPTKTTEFGALFTVDSDFTDDTILTIATACAVLESVELDTEASYQREFLAWGRRYPSSYGGRFAAWLQSPSPRAYNSFGNGSAMRVSPIGWAFESLEETLGQAALSAEPTHNHPEGVKGAVAVAHAIYIARHGSSKDEIRETIESRYGYCLRRTLDEIRPEYSFDETCQGTVPEAMIAFLESDDFESTVRNAISLGGDADTLACIAGSIAEPFYGGVPATIMERTRSILPTTMLEISDRFDALFRQPHARKTERG